MSLSEQIEVVERIARLENEIEKLKTIEHPSLKDPVYAHIAYIEYIKRHKGARGVWVYNLNHVDNNSVYWTSLPGLPNWRMHATRLFTYWQANRAAGDYMRSEGDTQNWQVDSGVHTWNDTPGLTIGTWIYPISFSTTHDGVLALWDASITGIVWRLQNLYSSGSLYPRFDVSSDGTSIAAVAQLTNPIESGRWQFLVGRWVPSTTVQVWKFDGDEIDTVSSSSGVPATLYRPTAANSNAYWGAYQNSSGGYEIAYNSYFSLGFFIVDALTDSDIARLYNMSRGIFGV